jgi:hypothetical protein
MERGTVWHGLQSVRVGIRLYRLRLRFLPDRNACDNGNDELGFCCVWGRRRSGWLALSRVCPTHIHTASIATGEGSLKVNLSISLVAESGKRIGSYTQPKRRKLKNATLITLNHYESKTAAGRLCTSVILLHPLPVAPIDLADN